MSNGQGIPAMDSAEARMPANGRERAWALFIRYCAELGHGEIDKLKIQDGVPVLAELTTKKVRFGS